MYEEQVVDKALIYRLTGRQLDDGWTVGDLIPRKVNQTGSHFSVGYFVEHKNGARAFLKAIDYRSALLKQDTARELEILLRTFNFERDLLDLCAGAKMSRVVVAISNGEIRDAEYPLPIPYLIFELAQGDVRARVDTVNAYEFSWSARALHHVATGLQQLHNKDVFHQDLKPSNVLCFEKSGSKLADLGRAFCGNLPAPHDDMSLPGALWYAPPEQVYNFQIAEGNARRSAGDLYLFGSMIHFFVTGQPITPQVVAMLRKEHRPARLKGAFAGSYDEVLPFWRDEYGKVIEKFRDQLSADLGQNNHQIVDLVVALLRYATEPDIRLRGHPSARRVKYSSPYDMQRFVSAFDLVATKLEYMAHTNNAARTARQAS